MRDEAQDALQRISDQLKQLTRLVAISVSADKKQREQILALARAGLDRHEIAEILGTTPGTVSVELSVSKRERKKKR
jgi:DNA-binding NarL/FixJ family response regulator